MHIVEEGWRAEENVDYKERGSTQCDQSQEVLNVHSIRSNLKMSNTEYTNLCVPTSTPIPEED